MLQLIQETGFAQPDETETRLSLVGLEVDSSRTVLLLEQLLKEYGVNASTTDVGMEP